MTKVLLLALVAMLAFAANSLLCRIALRGGHIDPASFTAVRIASGAAMLALIVAIGGKPDLRCGNWPSAIALFVYAAGFSFAYLWLPAGTGALILFGTVQATMIGYGVFHQHRLGPAKQVGLLLAGGGMVGLLMPGVSAPPLTGSLLMVAAGVAWGSYSLRGSGAGGAGASGRPVAVTAGNFLRAVPFAAALSLGTLSAAGTDGIGLAYAAASGAIASGLGYAVWYSALRGLRPIDSAAIQLSVPLIAALGGSLLLDERLTPRLVLAGASILGGIAIVLRDTITESRAVPSKM